MFNRLAEEGFGPVAVEIVKDRRLLFLAGAHRQEVADLHRGEVFADAFRAFVREEGDDLVVKGEAPLRDGESHCGGGPALADRKDVPPVADLVGGEGGLPGDLAVPDKEDGVEVAARLPAGGEEAGYPLRVDIGLPEGGFDEMIGCVQHT